LTETIKLTLDDMRGIGRRVESRQLTDGDWPIVSALVSARIAREEKRQERLARKLEEVIAAEASRRDEPGGEIIDVEHHCLESGAGEGSPAAEPDADRQRRRTILRPATAAARARPHPARVMDAMAPRLLPMPSMSSTRSSSA
jgi:hypothetical protein